MIVHFRKSEAGKMVRHLQPSTQQFAHVVTSFLFWGIGCFRAVCEEVLHFWVHGVEGSCGGGISDGNSHACMVPYKQVLCWCLPGCE